MNAETAWQLARQELEEERDAAPEEYRSRFRLDYLKQGYRAAEGKYLGGNLDLFWNDKNRIESLAGALEADGLARGESPNSGARYAAQMLKVVVEERLYGRALIEQAKADDF
jgi:hypothetical protein